MTYKCEIHTKDGKVTEIQQKGYESTFKYQPERSKREDLVEQFEQELIERSKLNIEIVKAQLGCGALNIVETQ